MKTMEKPVYKLLFIAIIVALSSGFIFMPISARKLQTNFQMLPKNTPLPPSGPSRGTSDPPPPPRTNFYSNSWNFRMLPKNTPLPPSGPSRGTSDPPPPLRANSYSSGWNFGMLPKNTPLPPSGPSKGPPPP
ncbi:hypothetical protein EZV62_016887 [Acer yangbiense]|uniref:Uncharacterized protein n=1 Tax=Acer yangbiense TaxID=1000413 RepID=A0A5C7HQL2_9ROSI|nr:hypothetical protein EZV62_016887 [Acer yangbiense]